MLKLGLQVNCTSLESRARDAELRVLDGPRSNLHAMVAHLFKVP